MTDKKYWLISLGKGSFFWEYCRKHNFIFIGWSELTDFSSVASLEELKNIFIDSGWGSASQAGADCPQIWNFSKVMEIGDVVLVKEGQKKILGIGEITSKHYRDNSKLPLSLKKEYENDRTEKDFSDIRDVKWFEDFPSEGLDIPMQQDWIKTVQEITKERADLLLNKTYKDSISIDFGSNYEINLLTKKKQIILYGPPGTGKTYNTKGLATELINNNQKSD